jgi:two-component sensor histidine kinase
VLAASGLIVVFFLLFVGVTGYLLLQGYNNARDRAEERAVSAARQVATNAGWIYETAQQALRRIDDAVADDLSTITGEDIADIGASVASLPGQVKIYVVDADGETRFSTDPNVKPINITDREYFQAALQGEETHVSGLLVSRLDGQQIFTISRRLERNGEFVGVAVISIDVALLGDFWTSLALGPLSAISLAREDGELVARFPPAPGPMNSADSVFFTDYLPRAATGTYETTSRADGVARIVGYDRVPGTKLIAVAAVGVEDVFAPFWRNATTTMLLGIPSAAGLAVVSIWIALLLNRDAQRRDELGRSLETNKLLFRELHHRVKNNLQSIQSLVTLQNIPPAAKIDLRNRIAAMAAVHEHLYRSDQYDAVEAAQYIPAVVDPLVHTYDGENVVEYRIESLTIDHDHATPLGLIVNEVVANALKYAFPNGRKGTIRVTLQRQDGGQVRLTVEDDGVGFDPEAVTSGMGGRLIAGITSQLLGKSHYERGDSGTRFVLEFPLAPAGDTRVARAASA